MLSRAPGPVAPPRLNLRASGCRPCAQPRRPHPHRLRAREPREPRLVRARAESEQLGEAFAVAERQAATDEEAMDVSSESWTSDADWAKAHGYSVDGMVREPRRCERARDNCGGFTPTDGLSSLRAVARATPSDARWLAACTQDVARVDPGLQGHAEHLQYRWKKFIERRRALEARGPPSSRQRHAQAHASNHTRRRRTSRAGWRRSRWCAVQRGAHEIYALRGAHASALPSHRLTRVLPGLPQVRLPPRERRDGVPGMGARSCGRCPDRRLQQLVP